MCRYGNPSVAPDEAADFSTHFLENYAALILQVVDALVIIIAIKYSVVDVVM